MVGKYDPLSSFVVFNAKEKIMNDFIICTCFLAPMS